MFNICLFFLFFAASIVGHAQSSEPLMSHKPDGSRVVRRSRVDANFGFTELTFMNGVQIILKPTDFENDKIQFAGFSPGGKSLYLDEDFMSATVAANIVKMSGLGAFDHAALNQKLEDNTARLSPYISEIYEGVNGWAEPDDLETLLQLNYLYFTAARRDEEAFNNLISQMRSQAANMRANPLEAYLDTLNMVVASNSPRVVTIPARSQINRIRLNHALNIYNDRFSDAGDFKFVMVGNFNVDAVIPLLETYLGGLPSRRRIETWRDVTPQFPSGVRVVRYPQKPEENSRVDFIMKGAFRWNIRERLHFEIFIELMKTKLRETMHEAIDDDFSIEVSGIVKRYPNPQYSLEITLNCAPENTDSLIDILFDEVFKLKENGPTVADLNAVKEKIISERETAMEGNEFWKKALLNTYREGDKPVTLQDFKKSVNSVRPRDIRAIARQYFNETNYVQGILSN